MTSNGRSARSTALRSSAASPPRVRHPEVAADNGLANYPRRCGASLLHAAAGAGPSAPAASQTFHHGSKPRSRAMMPALM